MSQMASLSFTPSTESSLLVRDVTGSYRPAESAQVLQAALRVLAGQVRGLLFYLYLFVDIFSRKVVGWQVFGCESAEKAATLLKDICRRQGVSANQITVHSDNGGPMKGETMLATMQRLGMAHTAAAAQR